MVEKHGAAVIRPLLLMMDFNDDQTHEMYSVTHTVESFPEKHYLAQVIAAVEEMQSVSPNYLRFVLGRIMNSDECAQAFVASGRSLPAQRRTRLVDVLEEVRAKYAGKDMISRNCSSAISELAK
jgi:hypothetical protein